MKLYNLYFKKTERGNFIFRRNIYVPTELTKNLILYICGQEKTFCRDGKTSARREMYFNRQI